jgi:hypothetical protein
MVVIRKEGKRAKVGHPLDLLTNVGIAGIRAVFIFNLTQEIRELVRQCGERHGEAWT